MNKANNEILEKEKKAIEFINNSNLNSAELIYRELIKEGVETNSILSNLAAICGMTGRNEEMLSILRKALKINPNFSNSHNNIGIALQRLGDLDGALNSYQIALKLKPDFAEAHNNIGLVFQKKGLIDIAISSFKNAIKINSKYLDALNNLGNSLAAKGDIEKAIQTYERAIKVSSKSPSAYFNLGNIFKQLGNDLKAIEYYKESLHYDPNFFKSYYNLGNIFKQKGDLYAAINFYEKTIKLQPNFPDVYNNIGLTKYLLGDIDNAIHYYNKAIKLKSNNSHFYNNLGVALKEIGIIPDAIDAYKRAIKINPNYSEAHTNLSHLLLLSGDYENGWLEYEHRSKKQINASLPHVWPKCPLWDGQLISRDEKLLVVSEQGLGDSLQYMRYIPYLRDQGICITFCAQSKLHSLIKSSNVDTDPLSPDSSEISSFDYWIPLLSIPRYLSLTKTNLLVTSSYISPAKVFINKWKDKFFMEKRPLVGLHWQGNPKIEDFYRGRSIPLNYFSKIIKENNINLISLQKGPGSEQLENCSFKDVFSKYQDEIDFIWDFNEIAGIISNIDLIITCDTVTAHLAGGMGKNVWLLLRDTPYWTWGLDGSNCNWYPNMKIFRQKKRHNWYDVIEEVSEELKLFISKKII